VEREGKRTWSGDDVGVAVVAVSVGTLAVSTCHSRAYVVDCYERVSLAIIVYAARMSPYGPRPRSPFSFLSSCEIHREKIRGQTN